MAQEAVLTIKKAESDAVLIIQNAEKEALEIIDNAEITAKQSIEELKNSLKTDYKNSVLTAKDRAGAMIKENLSKNQLNAEELEKKLLKNKDKAIDEVLKKVLKG